MANFKVELNGASELKQRHLQTLLKMNDPNALAQHGTDGQFGKEGNRDLKAFLEKNHIDLGDNPTIDEVIEALENFEPPVVNISNTPLADISSKYNKDIEYIQNLVRMVDDEAMPAKAIDGRLGPQTRGALAKVLPEGFDLENSSIDQIVTQLQGQVQDLNFIYAETGNTLTSLAKEHYAEEIEQHAGTLLVTSGYKNIEDARDHALDRALVNLAQANGKSEGVEANYVGVGERIIIPQNVNLAEVKGNLDYKALHHDTHKPPPEINTTLNAGTAFTAAASGNLGPHGTTCQATLKEVTPKGFTYSLSGHGSEQTAISAAWNAHASGDNLYFEGGCIQDSRDRNNESNAQQSQNQTQDSAGGGRLGETNSTPSAPTQLGS